MRYTFRVTAVVLSAALCLSSAHAMDLERQESCLALMKERVSAVGSREWGLLVDRARKYVMECESVETTKGIALALGDIALGLVRLERYADAIPVATRCIRYQPDNSLCLLNLGIALNRTKSHDKARISLQRVIDIGGYDTLTASLVDVAKQELGLVQVMSKVGASEQPEPLRAGDPESEQYVPVAIAYGVKIELPRNWMVVGPDQQQYILAKAKAALNLSGTSMKDSKRGVLLVARPVTQEKYASISITVQTTDLKYSDVAKMTTDDIQRWGEESRDALEKGLPASGSRLIQWIGHRRQEIAGKPTLIKQYKRSGDKGKNIFVAIVQFHDSPRLISVSTSAREGEESYWDPIAKHIVQSIQVN